MLFPVNRIRAVEKEREVRYDGVAALEPLHTADNAVREGEVGEQEEALHVSLGQWGTFRDCGFQEVYYDGVQDLFDISGCWDQIVSFQ